MVRSAEAQNRWGEFIYLETNERLNRHGNPQRDIAMRKRYPADRYIFLDDDDVFLPGALDLIRDADKEAGSKAIMFKVRYPHPTRPGGRLLWETKDLTAGNVGGSMFSPPRDDSSTAYWDSQWAKAYISDFFFIHEWVYSHGGLACIYWSDYEIIECRPSEERLNSLAGKAESP
jgi:hypothetical protein